MRVSTDKYLSSCCSSSSSRLSLSWSMLFSAASSAASVSGTAAAAAATTAESRLASRSRMTPIARAAYQEPPVAGRRASAGSPPFVWVLLFL